MKDEARFWKRIAIALALVLVIVLGTSSYYYSADLADVCNELSEINDTLQSIYWEL